MSREVLHGVLRATALAASVLAIALLAGCGGDDDDASDSTVAGTESVAPGSEQSGGEQSGGGEEGAADEGGGAADEGGGAADGEGGAADGEAGAADFGEEAEGADRAGAGRAVQEFLRAWADADWARACSLLAASTKENLAVFASQFAKSQACPEQLQALAEQLPAKTLPQDERIQVTAVRLEDGRGFVLYRNERGTETAFPVLQEGSAWRVAAIVGSILR